MTPERHIGYAVQWFAMTLTLAGLTFWWWRKASAHDDDKEVE